MAHSDPFFIDFGLVEGKEALGTGLYKEGKSMLLFEGMETQTLNSNTHQFSTALLRTFEQVSVGSWLISHT